MIIPTQYSKKAKELEDKLTDLKPHTKQKEKPPSLPKAKAFKAGSFKIDGAKLSKLEQQLVNLEDMKDKLSKASITETLEMIIAGGLKSNASDIHIEPEHGKVKLRYRLDGILHDASVLEKSVYIKALNRIKITSGLKLNIHGASQDGRFTIETPETNIEVRVSLLPSEYGETIVLRLLDPRTIQQGLDNLGINKYLLEEIKKQISKPTGAIFTTGPTGSGKTTALYAFTNYLKSTKTKIVTIEDPIEYHIEGISQTQINPKEGYDFSDGLQSIMRQDPDIILVGEIRNNETAKIAVRAALTGHLVLSTLHTNDASGSLPRLIDLGTNPQTIPSAVNLVLGQRLIRVLCTNCKVLKSPTNDELSRIRKNLKTLMTRFKIPEINNSLKIYFPGKCDKCNNSGYKGRTGIFEGFIISKEMEKLILKSINVSEIKDLAIKEGMVTMLQDGFLKLIEGITSIEEIDRVLE
jgi:type IV pilus assembly protein PilB